MVERIIKAKQIINSFTGKYSYDFMKAAGIASCLLDKAEQILNGSMKKGRWVWVDTAYTSADEMISQAEVRIKALKR